jgi:hypothetical protein
MKTGEINVMNLRSYDVVLMWQILSPPPPYTHSGAWWKKNRIKVDVKIPGVVTPGFKLFVLTWNIVAPQGLHQTPHQGDSSSGSPPF